MTRRLYAPVLVVIALAVTACTHLPAAPPRPPQHLPMEMVRYYSHDSYRAEVSIEDGQTLDRSLYRRTTYRLRAKGEDGGLDPLIFQHYVPHERDDPAPLVLVPEFLNSRIPERVARIFTDEGWQVMVHRWPELLDPAIEPAEMERRFRGLVISSRLALDWALENCAVDPDRIGALGASFGGMFNVVLAAVDRKPGGTSRLCGSVILMAGQDIASLIPDSSEGVVEDYCEAYFERTGKDADSYREEVGRAFRSDPRHLARYVDPSEVQMIVARFDTVVPRKYSLALHQSLGRPALTITPTGHYTIVLAYPWLRLRLKGYFHELFDSPRLTPSGREPDLRRGWKRQAGAARANPE